MASSLPPPEDVRAFRAAVDDALGCIDIFRPPLAVLDPQVAEAMARIGDACRDFDRAADLAALAPPKLSPLQEESDRYMHERDAARAVLPLADDLAHVVASELTAMQGGEPCDGLRLLAALDAYRKAKGA